MSIWLTREDLGNIQQMEVAVNGPDGATHLILCSGIANLNCGDHETYTFLVGPQISRRQFVGAIVSGALAILQVNKSSLEAHDNWELEAHLVFIDAKFDDESGQVKVSMEISSNLVMRLAISYSVSILAELTTF